MQNEQMNPTLQLALMGFREFAKGRIAAHIMGFDGQRFVHTTVQLVFEAFQAGEDHNPDGQLFASIRKDSEYHHQISWCIRDGIGHPFPVRFRAPVARYDEHVLEGGAGGAYRLADVDLHVMHDGELYRVAEGKAA